MKLSLSSTGFIYFYKSNYCFLLDTIHSTHIYSIFQYNINLNISLKEYIKLSQIDLNKIICVNNDYFGYWARMYEFTYKTEINKILK